MPSRSRWLVGSSRTRRSSSSAWPPGAADRHERAGQRHPLDLPAGQRGDVEVRARRPCRAGRGRRALPPSAHHRRPPCPAGSGASWSRTDSPGPPAPAHRRRPRARPCRPAPSSSVDLPPPLMPDDAEAVAARHRDRQVRRTAACPGRLTATPGGVDEDHPGILPDRPRPARTPLGTVTLVGRSSRDGILSEPIDLDRRRPAGACVPSRARPGGPRRRAPGERRGGLDPVLQRADRGPARSHSSVDRPLRNQPGGFLVDGRAGHPRRPDAGCRARPRSTASGSVAAAARPARVARASRILVEGIHDAELVEKVWGDDLRERRRRGRAARRHGRPRRRRARPRPGPGPPARRAARPPGRRLEGGRAPRPRCATRTCWSPGTPFVDVWAAVRPAVAGIDAWPDVPRGVPWKAGVLDALGHRRPPRRVLAAAARPGCRPTPTSTRAWSARSSS